MENFNEIDNKNNIRKMITIIIGLVIVAIIIVIFYVANKNSKQTFNINEQIPSSGNTSLDLQQKKDLYSKDISTWNNYFWPGKINTKYPSNWQIEELEYKSAAQLELEQKTGIKKAGEIVGLKITPPTDNLNDVIFIGGRLVSCTDADQYAKNLCLKNRIQMPFYTASLNPDVLSALDLVYQNTILTEDEK
ncbi:MAG: hypothetical protein US50_C0002G0019 [Candidatus Nomurabacteria bacterium GW2011_GWB1_37_5]|uniref:Uncharacterized protein n=1 Tax=Candidatus Nomurabacteria bacterium GW2011_GWB1_37_5 TaxID=1618742 RepID=A0A0G0JGS7_9BACT|nr:MAG: hypothetical protein US50_C0002G0019 [Candidatus Nomurabacteria bacterium GW2011_GWB1_37_5]